MSYRWLCIPSYVVDT
ncbi:hypothetical protein F383_04001 [Gossypium arboreum]|uniref:Uncharacterized protein n=1 Tax=Gossypium arboreum TaxID=29729 RepID=A0A0B0NY67_GOSAR|nr:hypothetical protein F383_04001 [Gossypium arboreum]